MTGPTRSPSYEQQASRIFRSGKKSEPEIVTYGDISPHMANILASSLADQCAETIDAIKRPIGKPEALGAGYGGSVKLYAGARPANPHAQTASELLGSWPTPQAPPQPKSKLVFYKSNKARDRAMNPGDLCLTGSMQERELILKHFDNGDLKTLYVHVSTGHGWRTKLTSDECEIEFLNEVTWPPHRDQARARLSPRIDTDDPNW